MIGRKGISPLIAAVLLIAFTMAVSALFAQWAPSLMQSAQQGVDERQSDVVDASSASMKIQQADFNSSSGNYTITVQNTGSANISNYTFTIYSETDPTQKNADITIEPGGIHTVTISTSDTEKSDVGVESRNLPVKTRVSSGQVKDATGSSGGNNGGGSSTITVSGEVFYDGSGWEDVKVEVVDSGSVIASALTDSTGSYSIDVSSGDYTVRATGASVSSTSLSDGTTLDFNVSGEVLKDGSVVDTFSSVSVSGCEVDGSTVETAYPKVGGERKISTVEQLQCVNQSLSSDYGLAQDVDASETDSWNGGDGFDPIGIAWSTGYGGTFDGNNYSVDGLYVNRSSDGVGLFADVDGGTLRNVAMVNGEVETDSSYAGILVGLVRNSGVKVVNSSSTGSVNATQGQAGGLVGYADSGLEVVDSHSTADLEATNSGSVGGLVGEISGGGNITDSYATGKVKGKNSIVGGLVGYICCEDANPEIKDSYATGNVTSTSGSEVGGLIGYFRGDIRNSYATGAVEGETNLGGLVGFVYMPGGGVISNSYSTGKVTSNSDNLYVEVGGLGGDVAEMHINTSYTTSDVYAPKANRTGGLAGGLDGSNITNSYALGDVTADGYAGGLVGYATNSVSREMVINKSYSASSIDANSSIGGLVATNNDDQISGELMYNSYWDNSTTGTDNATSDSATVTADSDSQGFLTSQMQGSSASSNMDGFDFQEVWTTVESPDDYPELVDVGP